MAGDLGGEAGVAQALLEESALPVQPPAHRLVVAPVGRNFSGARGPPAQVVLPVIVRTERCLMFVTQNRAAIATIAGGDLGI